MSVLQILLLENTMEIQLVLKILTFFNFEVPRSNGNRYKETHKTKFFQHLFSPPSRKKGAPNINFVSL